MSGHTGKRKIVKFRKEYKILVIGQTDTQYPEETPLALKLADDVIKGVIGALDRQYKGMTVTAVEVIDE